MNVPHIGCTLIVNKGLKKSKPLFLDVIGTPLFHYYPKKNAELQDIIRKEHLLISQVPFKRYID